MELAVGIQGKPELHGGLRAELEQIFDCSLILFQKMYSLTDWRPSIAIRPKACVSARSASVTDGVTFLSCCGELQCNVVLLRKFAFAVKAC